MVSEDAEPKAAESPLLEDLSEEERRELTVRHYVRKGQDLVWLEPEGTVRRERAERLYYLRTRRGIFRVSRLNQEVVEV